MTPFLSIFVASFLLSLVLTPLAAKVGLRLNMADVPGGRRRHAGRVARTGGIALFISFVAGSLLAQHLDVPRTTDPNEATRIGGLLIGLIIVFGFGLLDDKFEFQPGWQFVAQFMASLIAIASLIFIERFNNPMTNQPVILQPWQYLPLSLFWLMGMMNTVNWLDGLDGLAAGIAVIFSGILFLAMLQDTATHDPQVSLAPLPLALFGATLGFLPYNFYPAKVFMGSSGSLVLGYALGCLGIIGGAKMATVLLVLAVPIIDVAWLIVSRTRRGKSPFQGGRDHLHFRLLDLGLSQRQIVIGYYFISALFGALALLIEARIYKLLALGLLGMVTLVVLIVVAKKSESLETKVDR